MINLQIEYQRDAALRAYEVIFTTVGDEIGCIVVVHDGWLRDRNLSMGTDGVIGLTLMSIFAAVVTRTVKEAGLRYEPPAALAEGVRLVA